MDNTIRQEKERKLWDKLASNYDGNTQKTYKAAYDESIKRTISLLKPDDRVLEIGCGTGIISLGIASHVKQVFGVDISPNMIAVARAKAADQGVKNATFQTCDGYSIQFEDGSFDYVLLFNILHVVKEPATLICEAHRLLKAGGYIISATDCIAEPAGFFSRITLVVEWLMKQLGIIPFIYFFKKKDVDSLIMQNGFTIHETADLHPSPVNYYIRAKK